MTAKEIYDILNANQHNYRYFGIRTCDNEYQCGDTVANSYNWDDDEANCYELDRACATGFDYLWLDDDSIDEDMATISKALAINACYRGKHVYLIAGMDSEYGNDESEIIISSAEVVAVIK